MRISIENLLARIMRLENLDFLNNGVGWANISLDSGWTAASGFDVPRYKAVTINGGPFLVLSGAATLAGSQTTAKSLNSSNPLPIAPVATHRLAAYDSTPTQRFAVQIAPTGIIGGLANAAGAQIIELNALIPLD